MLERADYLFGYLTQLQQEREMINAELKLKLYLQKESLLWA
jgi:hypothetical protein